MKHDDFSTDPEKWSLDKLIAEVRNGMPAVVAEGRRRTQTLDELHFDIHMLQLRLNGQYGKFGHGRPPTPAATKAIHEEIGAIRRQVATRSRERRLS